MLPFFRRCSEAFERHDLAHEHTPSGVGRHMQAHWSSHNTHPVVCSSMVVVRRQGLTLAAQCLHMMRRTAEVVSGSAARGATQCDASNGTLLSADLEVHMHARVVTATLQRDKIDECIRIGRDSIVPEAKQQPGFRDYLFLTDRATGDGVQ